MPRKKHLRGVGAKEQRQYEHIRESARNTARYGDRAEEVAAPDGDEAPRAGRSRDGAMTGETPIAPPRPGDPPGVPGPAAPQPPRQPDPGPGPLPRPDPGPAPMPDPNTIPSPAPSEVPDPLPM